MSTSDASKELARIDIHEAALQGTMNCCFRARKLHLQTVILTDLLMSEMWPVFETIFAAFKARQMRVPCALNKALCKYPTTHSHLSLPFEIDRF